MSKIRRVVRKPPIEQQGDVFEEQLWPTYIALIVLGAFSIGVSLAYASFSSPNWESNAWTYVVGVPVIVGGLMLGFTLLDNRMWRRSIQFSAVIGAIIHLALVVQMYQTGLFVAQSPPTSPDARVIERRPHKPVSIHRTPIQATEERPQQDHERPVETAAPELSTPAAETARIETPQNRPPAAPTRQPPIAVPVPVPASIPTTEPNLTKKAQPNEAAPKFETTTSRLSRQVKPSESKISSLIPPPVAVPQVQQPKTAPAEVRPAASPAERPAAAPTSTAKNVTAPTAPTPAPVAGPARRSEQNSPTVETAGQPTLPRQIARPEQTPRSQVAAVDTPGATKQTSKQDLAPANTQSTKTITASPARNRNRNEPLLEASSDPATPQPQRRQVELPPAPAIAQAPSPIPNRQPRSTGKSNTRTQADTSLLSGSPGESAGAEASLTPRNSASARSTAAVTTTRPADMPSAEPTNTQTNQPSSRVTRTAGQPGPLATNNPTQAPTFSRNSGTGAPSIPGATKVAEAATGRTQVATSGDLSPSSTATQRATKAAEQQAPTTGQPRPSSVASNNPNPTNSSTAPRRSSSGSGNNAAPAAGSGPAQVASRSTKAGPGNGSTTVANVPGSGGTQTDGNASIGPSTAVASRQTGPGAAGATRTQPSAPGNVTGPTAQFTQGGGAARAGGGSGTATLDPGGTPGPSPNRAIARAAQATSPTGVDSPTRAVAAAGNGSGAGDSLQAAATGAERATGSLAGVGGSPNMDRSTPGGPAGGAPGAGGTGTGLAGSSTARRADTTQTGPAGNAAVPTAPGQLARGRGGVDMPTASLRAVGGEQASSPGSTDVAGEITANSSATLTRADSNARRGEVTGVRGTGEVDFGPPQLVAEAGGRGGNGGPGGGGTGSGRAGGGGQGEPGLESIGPQLSRAGMGGSPNMSLASARVGDDVAAPAGTGGGQGSGLEPGPAGGSAARTEVAGTGAASGGPSRAAEQGPLAEANAAGALGGSAVARAGEGTGNGSGAAGLAGLEDEEEKAKRLARQAAGGGPQLAIGGPIIAEGVQSPQGAGGDGGFPNASPQVAAASTATGRQNRNGGAPRGGSPLLDGEPGGGNALGGEGRGGSGKVGSTAVARAGTGGGGADIPELGGAVGATQFGGGTGKGSRTAKGMTLGSDTRAETVEVAGAPASGGVPNGQALAAQGTDPQRLAGGAPGVIGSGPTGALAGAQIVDTAVAGGPGTGNGRRNAGPGTANEGPEVGGPGKTAGGPGARAATTQVAGVGSTAAEMPTMGPTEAVVQAELDHGMGNMGTGPMTRNTSESVTVNIEAPDGVGGLGAEHTPRVGLNSRQAREDSVNIQVQAARFLRQQAGGLPATSTSVVIATDPYANRSMRGNGVGGGRGRGAPPPATDNTIELGLRFLARNQLTDGRWTLQGYGEETQLSSDTAATALALLAFQGHGHTHREHEYKSVVRAGLEFLLAHQRENGDLFVATDDNANQSTWLYSHALGAIALCEAYGMTQDPELRVPAQKAIDFIVEAQHKERGGWRYAPGVGSDTSVSGWMLMALKSGELANLTVPKETYAKIDAWLNSAEKSSAAPHEFRYNPYAPDTPEQRHGLSATKTMTAVGLTMRMHRDTKLDSDIMRNGADYLKKNLPAIGTPREPLRDTYYWYYGTQVMFAMGGDHWEAWNAKLNPLLVNSQIKTGPLAGSWQPRGPVPDRWSAHAGRLYVTTMNLLSLEVHYRRLVLYENTAPPPQKSKPKK
ncbi:hypothetical protein [Anatilimnocola floriformis]|uniref:hypothetical protein n=1 Tax=Anatilimnocola floriformis TaxID=2948575 RepID=UPI0020C54C05|nr:hypothetical protein [Anatilimnocola floriformis]